MSKLRIYWDAVSYLAFLKAENGRVGICRQVLDAGDRGEIEIATSTLTLIEVVHLKGRPKMTASDETAIRDLFERPSMVLIDANRHIAEMARQLIWQNP